MQNNTFTLKAKDDKQLQCYKWEAPKKKSKAIVVIAHGMGEHAARYGRSADFLVSQDFVVYAIDHRGHGKTAENEQELGFFAADNGWNLVVADLQQLMFHAKKEHIGLPIFLLGHSMGSFIVRTLLIENAVDVSGAILSGTAGDPGAVAVAGKLVAKLFSAISGKTAKSQMLNNIGFGKFNAAFKPNRTKFDWISRDNVEVDKYDADPKCGFDMSNGFMLDLTYGISLVNSAKAFESLPKDFPLILMSGDKDPVSDNGKGVKEVYENYRNAGLTDVEIKLYPDARHEILNELNRQEVLQDMLEWMLKRI